MMIELDGGKSPPLRACRCFQVEREKAAAEETQRQLEGPKSCVSLGHLLPH